MNQKPAIIIDTNFIIEHKSDLRTAHEKLSDKYDVYVTDISIQERLSQKYLELKLKYEKVEKFIQEYSSLATITLKNSFDDKVNADRSYTLKSYESEFGKNIIAFTPDDNTLKTVMDRVYRKIPPFINAENASDKGFKDTLLWISILSYFKNLNYSKVLFITNDKGFLNAFELLTKEFLESTGKEIEIKDNNFYNSLWKQEVESEKQTTTQSRLSATEKSELREQIQDTIYSLCHIHRWDEYGEDWWEKAFSSGTWIDTVQAENIFVNMPNIIRDHILEINLRPSVIWGSDLFIQDKHRVSIEEVEKSIDLYNRIKSKYSDYMLPFLNAVCEIVNGCYDSVLDSDEFPF